MFLEVSKAVTGIDFMIVNYLITPLFLASDFLVNLYCTWDIIDKNEDISFPRTFCT